MYVAIMIAFLFVGMSTEAANAEPATGNKANDAVKASTKSKSKSGSGALRRNQEIIVVETPSDLNYAGVLKPPVNPEYCIRWRLERITFVRCHFGLRFLVIHFPVTATESYAHRYERIVSVCPL